MTRARTATAATATVLALAGGLAAIAQSPAGPALRRVHTPAVVVDDAHLRPGTCHPRTTRAGVLPDPGCTPGAVDPALTAAVICAPGWSTTRVRPPAQATGRYKVLAEDAYSLGAPDEYDHLVPLTLGGASATTNLWPEPGSIPNAKDTVENALHRAVCAGRITLPAAQARIATDWTTATRGLP